MKKLVLLCVMCLSNLYAGKMNIIHIDKVALLRALFQGAQPLTHGLSYCVPGEKLTDSEIESNVSGYIGQLKDRVLNIDISGRFVETDDYNKINGPDAAEKIIRRFYTEKNVN